MSRLKELYEQLILDHNKKPRNFGDINPITHFCHGHNPLCGDDYQVMLNVVDGMIENIAFKGDGCAISKASGSLMTSALKGMSIKDALLKKDIFLKLVTTDGFEDKSLGKLHVFEGVRNYPVRVKCAALVWRALEGALDESNENKISTE